MTSPILDLSANNIKSLVFAKTNIGGWFFDAYLKLNHTSRLTITDQPVQSGSSLTDNAYLQPRTLDMDVAMSDVATSLVSGQFNSGSSRSVNAYQILRQLQQLRVPIQVYTRLGTYENMLIEVLSAPDDFTTQYGLKCTVSLKEVLVAKVRTVKISARPVVSNSSSSSGSPQPAQPQKSVLSQILGGLTGNFA